MIDLIAIRARDEDDYATAEVLRNIQWAGNTDPELTATINMVADRHALLAAYDALAAENARLREENERLTAANKARAEYLTNRRAGNDLDSYVNLAETKIEELRAQLAEAQEELAQWRATGESVTRNEHDLSARLAALEAERALIVARAENAERGLVEAEQILSACYSPVRLIAEGGSRTRADLDLAAETFAALKRYLKPEAARLDAHLSRKP